MGQSNRLVLGIFVVLVVVVVGLFGYYSYGIRGKASSDTSRDPVRDGVAPEVQVNNTDVKIENNIRAGEFVRAQEGRIFFMQDSQETGLPTSDNFAFVCTSQIIGDEPVVNYDQVKEVRQADPVDLVDIIEPGEPILVMTHTDESGEFVANSVVSSRCGINLQ